MCDELLSRLSVLLSLPVWEAVHRDVTLESGGGVEEDEIVCVCVCVDGVLMGGRDGQELGENGFWGQCTCSPQ